jgi:hypothetical protein
MKNILPLLFFIVTACAPATSMPTAASAPDTPTAGFTVIVDVATITPTPTNTPKPTETFTPSPTETPGPMWRLGSYGEFPHVINDSGQETFNFSKSQIGERDVKEQKKLSHRFSQLYGSRI